MSNNRVLITGGSGFIGTNLVSYFSDNGWEVINFDIVGPRNPSHHLYWKKVDLLDRTNLVNETQSFAPSVFLHFGARSDLRETKNLAGYAANIEGVCNVVDAIRSTSSVQRVIFASSQLVCNLGYVPINDDDYLPSTLYGQSKVLSEKIIRSADLDVYWTIIRPTSLWGPWFDVPYKSFFNAIDRNLYVHPGGITTLKQWGYIGNSIFQIFKIISAPWESVHRKTLYLADYQPLILKEFADAVQKIFDARPITTVPAGFMNMTARIGDICQALGWENPPLTSFRYQNIVTNEVHNLSSLEAIAGPLPFTVEKGIEATVNWLRETDNSMELGFTAT